RAPLPPRLARSAPYLTGVEPSYCGLMNRLIATIALVAALAFVVVACGGDDTPAAEEPAGTNLLAQYCPLEVVESESGVEQYGDPVEGAWDTSEIVGKPLGEAEKIAADNGCYVEVS